MTEQRARTETARAFTELPVRDVAFIGEDVDSDAYLVNNEWVFRFPKREAVARAPNREVALLPKLAACLPVATPRFAYIGHQTGSGLLTLHRDPAEREAVRESVTALGEILEQR